MGITTRRTVIGGITYEVQGFGAKQGQRILVVLSQILGAGAGPLLARGQDGAGEGLRGALMACTAQAQTEIVDAFVGRCSVVQVTTGGAEIKTALAISYDDQFAGKYLDWGKWLAWCVQGEYADFFGVEAKGLMVALMAKAQGPDPSKSESPPGSNGPSGES